MNIAPYRSPVSDIVLSSSNTVSKRDDLTPDFILSEVKRQNYSNTLNFYNQKSLVKTFFKQKYIKIILKKLKSVDWNVDSFCSEQITFEKCESFLFSSFEIKKRFAFLQALKMFAVSGWVVAISMKGKTSSTPLILHENSLYEFKDNTLENNQWFLMHEDILKNIDYPITMYVKFFLARKIKHEKSYIQYFLKFEDEYTLNSFLNKSGLIL